MPIQPKAAGMAALTVFALFFLGAVGFWTLDYSQRQDLLLTQVSARAHAAEARLSNQFQLVFADLLYLSQSGTLVQFEAHKDRGRAAVEQQWRTFLQHHSYLQQIRMIDPLGRERLRVDRVNGKIEAVPPTALQDKQARYYFQAGLKLKPGQVYLSPLDMNVEHGVVEQPLRPMIRFVLRLQDVTSGAPGNLLVLNVDANYLLQPLLHRNASEGVLMVADAQGRLIIDGQGKPYWQYDAETPVAQYSGSWQGGAQAESSIQNGEAVARIRLSVVRLFRSNVFSAEPLRGAVTLPWTIIARESLSLLPQPTSLWQLVGVTVLLSSLLLLCLQLIVRGRQLERTLVRSRTFQKEALDRAHENATMLEQLGEGVVVFNDDQKLVRINEQAKRLLGSRVDASGDCTAQSLLPEVCRFGYLQAGSGDVLLDTEPPSLLHVRVSHLMCGSRPCHLALLSEHDNREAIDRQLLDLSQALDASEEMVLLLRLDCRVLFMNATASRAFGRTAVSEIGLDVTDLGFHLDDDLPTEMARLRGDGASTQGSGELVSGGQVRSISYELRRISVRSGTPHYMLRVRDITHELDAEAQLNRLSDNDLLRAAPNRMQVAREFEHLAAESTSLALMVIDIDRLRHINNSLGYRAGDSAIRQFSRRLIESAPDCYVARLTGDSFVMICQGDEMKLFEVVDAVKRAMSLPMIVAGQQIKMTFSVGVAYWPEHARQFEPLLQAAQIALNHIKGMRGQVAVFEPTLAERSRALLKLEEFLKQAIEEERFELYYQPVVNASTGRVEQYEALMRLRDLQGNPISPDEFIPLLEESGWIMLLEPWLLRSAAQAAVVLARRMEGGSCVAVNLCGMQLLDEGFVERLMRIMAESRCEPQWLSLEVTERQFLEYPEKIIRVLTALRELGIRVAVDDFGTGYSSLAYIKRLPVEHLKIDREFVRELPHSLSDEAIVRSVGRMADGLGMKIIAEGVETVEQMRWLYQHGIVLYQGYLFARPAPLDTWLTDEAIAQVLRPLAGIAGENVVSVLGAGP